MAEKASGRSVLFQCVCRLIALYHVAAWFKSEDFAPLWSSWTAICNITIFTQGQLLWQELCCRFSLRSCEDKSFSLKLQSCPPSSLCVMWPGHLVIHSFWAGLYTILLHEDHHGNTRSGRSSWLPLSSFQVCCTWTVLTLIPSICRQNCWMNQNFLHYLSSV